MLEELISAQISARRDLLRNAKNGERGYVTCVIT